MQSEDTNYASDGSKPLNIAEGTGSAAPTNSASAALALGGASSHALIGIAVSSLVAVFSAFTILA